MHWTIILELCSIPRASAYTDRRQSARKETAENRITTTRRPQRTFHDYEGLLTHTKRQLWNSDCLRVQD